MLFCRNPRQRLIVSNIQSDHDYWLTEERLALGACAHDLHGKICRYICKHPLLKNSEAWQELIAKAAIMMRALRLQGLMMLGLDLLAVERRYTQVEQEFYSMIGLEALLKQEQMEQKRLIKQKRRPLVEPKVSRCNSWILGLTLCYRCFLLLH